MERSATGFHPIFVGRQTVFDASLTVWGHELLFRAGDSAITAVITDPDQATATVITEGFSMATAMIPKTRKILINYPEGLILNEAPLALPPEQCVVEVLEDVRPTEDVLKALRRLKSLGYTIALDDYIGNPEHQPFLELADIIKVDVLGLSSREIIKIGQYLQNFSCRLLAEKIETREVFDLTLSLGFSYFQGMFFSQPETLTGRTIPTTAVNRLRLVHEMASSDFEVSRVSGIISQDAGLSFRLLKHINSAYYSLPSKVKNISQVVALLGENALRRWLMLSMLVDLGPGGRNQDLIYTSIHRARFLEMLAMDKRYLSLEPDVMYLLGLFSNLDALLNLPMAEILTHLPLETEISAALLGEPNRLRYWIEMAIAIEKGDWTVLLATLQDFGLKEEETALKHLHAAAWAARMLGFQDSEEVCATP